MSDKPRLFYFQFRGRGELCRLVLTEAGVDYEDVRFDREQWANEYKEKSPSGQCPYLELPDGKKLTQSSAIARYYGREKGLYGKDNWEMFLCDRAMQQVDDMEEEFTKIFFMKPEERESSMLQAVQGKAHDAASTLEKFIKESGTGFVAGNSVTIGDLAIFKSVDLMLRFPTFRLDKAQHESLSQMANNFLKSHPELLKHRETILSASPAIKNYIDGRPVTPSY